MSEGEPFFSVVIPVYNRADSISKSIESVKSQPFPSFEIVVVDDGSTDDTSKRVEDCSDNRMVYFFQQNAGVSAARNTGVTKSSGQYLMFLDSDDEMARDFLPKAYDLIRSSPQAQCYCFSTVFKRPGKEDNLLRPGLLGALYANKRGLFLAGTFVIRKDIFIKIGGYDDKLAFGENDELGQRICKECEIVCSDELSLISHRVTKKEKNTRYKREIMAKTLLHYLEIYRDELRQKDRPRLISLNNRLAICYFVMKEDSLAKSLLIATIKNNINLRSIRILVRIILFPTFYRKFLNTKGLV